MDIRVEEGKDVIKVKLVGDIFVEQGDLLMNTFNSIVDKNPKQVVIDMSELKSITSSGIGKIVLLYKKLEKNGGKIKIVGVNDTISQIFKIVKLDKLIEIEGLSK